MSTETELKGTASKSGAKPIEHSDPDIVTRDATQIQAATRANLESMSSYVATQLNEAVITRSSEKLALFAIQNSDQVVEGAIKHLQSFLPKILATNPLMFERELDQLMGTESA